MVQGVLLAADQITSVTQDVNGCHQNTDLAVCQNGTANHSDDVDESSPVVSRVRLVQFEKNAADPLVHTHEMITTVCNSI